MRHRWAAAAGGLLLAACGSGPQPREATPAAPAGHAVRYRNTTGTLAGFDPVSRVVTLKSVGGDGRYHVADDARLWLGSRRLPTSQLGAHVGAEVTLAYGENGDGLPTTHTLRLREGHER